MAITDVFQVKKIKAELEQTRRERDAAKAILAQTESLALFEIQQAIAEARAQKTSLEREVDELGMTASKAEDQQRADFERRRLVVDRQIAELDRQIVAKKQDLVILDDEILLQSFGFYKPRYDLQSSDAYKARLEEIRKRQAAMVKAGEAAICPTNWTVNNNKKDGERMIRDYTKLVVRSFNNECDATIVGVKYNNIEALEKRIRSAFDALNRLTRQMSISIVPQYLDLKVTELHLCYEYQVKKQEEKEEQKRIREQMREEARLLREIEEQRQKLEKEEKHFDQALQSIDEQLDRAIGESERLALEQAKATILLRLDEIAASKLDIQTREQNTRAGYVYVISNVGSFGEDVYKIGVTRRLEPTERVDELGDSSVPFDFDIHAMIFSDDAPALETALHRAFAAHKVNMINERKEFFHVTLDEVEEVVRTSFNKPVEFARQAEAAEYRQSTRLRSIQVTPTLTTSSDLLL